MHFEERSYSSSLMRPRPLIYHEPGQQYILILTVWGSSELGPQIIDHIKQHLQSVKQDSEFTTPFQNILTLSDEANHLRVSTLMTNDFVFRGINQEKYQALVETCFFSIQDQHVAWTQMGGPHIFLKKKGEQLQPVSCYPESRSELRKCPMPSQFLGAEPTISPRSGDFYLENGDEIILLSSSTIAPQIWSLQSETTLESLTDSIAAADESQPFWLGRFKID